MYNLNIMQYLLFQVLGKREIVYINQNVRLEAFENVDAETAKFQDNVSSKEIDQNYVELYRKEHCEIHWLCLMVFGDSGTGKTRLIHRLLNKPDSESTNTGKLEVSDCIISGTDTPDPVWKIPRCTFHERVKKNFPLKFPDVMSSEGGLRQSWVEIGNGGLMQNSSLEVKIWDVSSNWGAHNSHKVFLTPSSVCLLTLNVEYGLHTPIRNDSGNERSLSPLESLDHWLQMIDMSTTYDNIEYIDIVSSHTLLVFVYCCLSAVVLAALFPNTQTSNLWLYSVYTSVTSCIS